MINELRRNEPIIDIAYYDMDSQRIDRPPVGSGVPYFPDFKVTYPSGILGKPLTFYIIHTILDDDDDDDNYYEVNGPLAPYHAINDQGVRFNVYRDNDKVKIESRGLGELPNVALDIKKLGDLFNVIHTQGEDSYPLIA